MPLSVFLEVRSGFLSLVGAVSTLPFRRLCLLRSGSRVCLSCFSSVPYALCAVRSCDGDERSSLGAGQVRNVLLGVSCGRETCSKCEECANDALV